MSKGDAVNYYDVVVVGAGIQGAGIAERASAEGWSVLILERNASVGLETSSNSSKLIHGGLRYLETMEFSLVYECLSERKWLLQNIPSLVSLKPFYIPIYKNSRRKSWWIFLGLSFYALLGGLRKENRFRRVPKSQWSSLGVSTYDLSAVFQYFDAQTDDKELTSQVSQSAQALGAALLCGTELLSAKLTNKGYELGLSNGQFIQCKALVNASGPWVNQAAELIEGAPLGQLQWVQGSHIVLDIPSFTLCNTLNVESESCFYFESPVDGRAFFVLPWKGKVMVGTTEVPLSAPRAEITPREVEYLLESYNNYFPEYTCTRKQILKTYSGIRVLPFDHSSVNPSKKSRETIFLQSKNDNSHYVAVYGGKLTSYRATAAKVINILKSSLRINHT